VIQQRIQNPLAMRLIEGDFSEGDTAKVDANGKGFTFEIG